MSTSASGAVSSGSVSTTRRNGSPGRKTHCGASTTTVSPSMRDGMRVTDGWVQPLRRSARLCVGDGRVSVRRRSLRRLTDPREH